MADKPKTYPQKLAEAQTQLQMKDDQINELLQQTSSIEEMQSEIAYLREQLEIRSKQDQTGSVSSKTQMVDLEQRVVAAEGALKASHNDNSFYKNRISGLEQLLDIAGAERDKNLGKDRKIELLSETIKSQNLQVANTEQRIRELQKEHEERIIQMERASNSQAASARQQFRDFQIEYTEKIARMEKQVHNAETNADSYARQLGNVIGILNDAPDIIGQLKNVLRLS